MPQKHFGSKKVSKNCVSQDIVHLIEIANFQIHRAYAVEVIWKNSELFIPQDIEILSWCSLGSVLPYGDKVPL